MLNNKSRILIAFSLLLALLLPAIAITFDWAEFPKYQWLESNLRFLPYAVFGIGLVLCWLFYNSREFNLFIIIAVAFAAISQFFWAKGFPGFQRELLFNILSVLIPLNFLIFNYLKERGILNQHGIKRLLFVAAQIIGVIWLVKTNQFGISTYLSIDVSLHPLQGKSIIKQPGQLMMALSLTILCIHWLLRPNQLRGAWILALISMIIALHFILDTQIATVYFMLAGLILLSAIIMNSYNLAYKDELTQMSSRRALKQELASLGKTYSLAMVDVDHFKKLNDNYGHDVGDEVLKMLAAHLQSVEGGGKAFRYGGEEFTIVFAGKDASSATVYLNALRNKIASTPFIVRDKKRPKDKSGQKQTTTDNTKKLNVTVSIGVAEKQAKHGSTQDIMKSADNALYKAKKRGRNRVEIEQ
ncbi:MAG: diguanylate cyclase (GGDEF)-like protein [Gammaproteobacteria bacterium]|jgi:diguanylate cyclase (GGDEF)-like protein